MKPSLAIAYNVKRHMAKKKMAAGGMVAPEAHAPAQAEEHEELAEQAEPSSGDIPKQTKSRGGLVEQIMRKKFGHGEPAESDDPSFDDVPEESYLDEAGGDIGADTSEHGGSPRGGLVAGVLDRIRARKSAP
jgi:hypothetical protein